MLIIFRSDCTQDEMDAVVQRLRSAGCEPPLLKTACRTTIQLQEADSPLDPEDFRKLPGVSDVVSVMKPYRLVSRLSREEDTEIRVKGVTFGPRSFVVMAGPCAVESEAQALRIARAVKRAGAQILRGGAFKPRSSPYSFQGMGLEGLQILKRASEETGLPVITEALDSRSLEQVYEYADIIQIGTRNMQNFSLLKEVGKLDKPVMLKRGMSATIDEWLQSAEYLMSNGNQQILLCERGIRSFDAEYSRNVVDLGAVPVVRSLSHLPIVIDPSHGTGRRDAIEPLSLASLAVGANAVLVDVHDQPQNARCCGAQAISPEAFGQLVERCRQIAAALGKSM
jgi:3-deoxy-7-phosphoheptulonate synthase